MRFLSFHPSMDVLSDFRADGLDRDKHARVAGHLRDCARCQSDLRFVTRIDDRLQASSLGNDLPSGVLGRAIASRHAGERRILPSTNPPRAHTYPSAWLVAGIAAAVITAAAVLVFARAPELSAVSTHSEMRLSPAQPATGERIDVAYAPMTGLFSRSKSLVLRARLRTANDGMYSSGMAATRIRSVTTLERRPDGKYVGSFVLPDSVVFASLVVEDDSATRIDDNDARTWEVTTYGADHRPTYDAIAQRVNDMMGRSWDEAYKSAQQLTTLYPGELTAWTLLEFFDDVMHRGEMNPRARVYTGKIDSLTKTLHQRRDVPERVLSEVFYRVSHASQNGTAADSAELRYWIDRVTREYPRNTQLAQYYAERFTHADYEQPARMLDSLERLYATFAPVRGPGRNLVNVAMNAVSRLKDPVQYRRWHERLLDGSPDSAYRTALDYVARPEFRAEGEAAIRELLSREATPLVRGRALAETPRELAERATNSRRRLLVALGTALIADGRTSAAIDTLNRAAAGVWDPQIFRSLRSGYAAAGDTPEANRIALRLAVDPRTPSDSAEAMVRAAKAGLGSVAVDSLTRLAKEEMRARFLDRSTTKALRGAATVVTADGKRTTLRSLTGSKASVVIFWSLHCGWAIQALPAIMQTAERLHADGVPVVFIAGDSPSNEVTAYLKEKKWKLPVYFDSNYEAGNAFANFGTPQYYVLDGAGRIRFDEIEDDQAELIAQVRALQMP